MSQELVKCECMAHTDKKGIKFNDNIEGIREWPMSKNFPEGEVSYRLNNFSEDFRDKWQTTAIVVALRAWQWRIKKLKFRRERNPTAHVDAEVWWRPPEVFSGPNVFAHGYYPGQGEVSGNVELNDSWDYVPGVHLSKMNHPPLVPIMIHEFGHSVIGLTHDPTSNLEMMYPSFNIGSKKTVLGNNDISRAQGRHGARSVSQHILDYFMNRRQMGWDFKP